jgi:hypothetical protein
MPDLFSPSESYKKTGQGLTDDILIGLVLMADRIHDAGGVYCLAAAAGFNILPVAVNSWMIWSLILF